MHSIIFAFLDIQQMYSIFLHFRYHLRLISHTKINGPATMGGEEDASSDLPYRYSQTCIIFWSFSSSTFIILGLENAKKGK
jgi:hypothetical protein